jgi:hypothetical protein
MNSMFARRINIKRGANVLGELLLIIVGINIALWFEGVFENVRDSKTEVQYLGGLAGDLLVDLDQLAIVIKSNRAKLENIRKAMPMLKQLAANPADQQMAIIFEPSGYQFFQPSDFTYQSMQESGDFRLLSDAEIKSEILKLARHYRHIDNLQTNFLQALDSGYIPLVMNSVDVVGGGITNPSLVENQLFVNFFAFTYQDTETRLKSYVKAKDMASALLDKIRLQLEEN